MSLKGKSPIEMSTINVTPMVDVMLVLLIIFMVITPLLQKGVSVDMANALNTQEMPNANKSDAVVLAITRDGKIYLGSNEINADQVNTKVKDMLENQITKMVYLKSDRRAKWGDVTSVVDDVRAAGVEDLGLITQQVERRPGVPPTAATP